MPREIHISRIHINMVSYNRYHVMCAFTISALAGRIPPTTSRKKTKCTPIMKGTFTIAPAKYATLRFSSPQPKPIQFNPIYPRNIENPGPLQTPTKTARSFSTIVIATVVLRNLWKIHPTFRSIPLCTALDLVTLARIHRSFGYRRGLVNAAQLDLEPFYCRVHPSRCFGTRDVIWRHQRRLWCCLDALRYRRYRVQISDRGLRATSQRGNAPFLLRSYKEVNRT